MFRNQFRDKLQIGRLNTTATQEPPVPVPIGGSLLYPQRVKRSPTGGVEVKSRLLRRRLIEDGERSYRVYSADELIELDSLANHGRPGHLY